MFPIVLSAPELCRVWHSCLRPDYTLEELGQHCLALGTPQPACVRFTVSVLEFLVHGQMRSTGSIYAMHTLHAAFDCTPPCPSQHACQLRMTLHCSRHSAVINPLAAHNKTTGLSWCVCMGLCGKIKVAQAPPASRYAPRATPNTHHSLRTTQHSSCEEVAYRHGLRII